GGGEGVIGRQRRAAVAAREVDGAAVAGRRVAEGVLRREREGKVVAGRGGRAQPGQAEGARRGGLDRNAGLRPAQPAVRRVRGGQRLRGRGLPGHVERVRAVVGRCEGVVGGQDCLRVRAAEVDGVGVTPGGAAGGVAGRDGDGERSARGGGRRGAHLEA